MAVACSVTAHTPACMHGSDQARTRHNDKIMRTSTAIFFHLDIVFTIGGRTNI
jgi:hypothetical protein